jgi:hypothetical protein
MAFTQRSRTDWNSFLDTVIEEHRALQTSAGGLSTLLEGCLMMDEAKDEPMEVDEEDDPVAQAVNASAQMKDQAEDAAAWEHDIALWNDLMMSLIIIQPAGGEKEEEVKKISHNLHLLEKRLKNKAGVTGYAKWVGSCV